MTQHRHLSPVFPPEFRAHLATCRQCDKGAQSLAQRLAATEPDGDAKFEVTFPAAWFCAKGLLMVRQLITTAYQRAEISEVGS